MLKGWGLNLKKALNNVNILCGKMMVVFESILNNPTVNDGHTSATCPSLQLGTKGIEPGYTHQDFEVEIQKYKAREEVFLKIIPEARANALQLTKEINEIKRKADELHGNFVSASKKIKDLENENEIREKYVADLQGKERELNEKEKALNERESHSSQKEKDTLVSEKEANKYDEKVESSRCLNSEKLDIINEHTMKLISSMSINPSFTVIDIEPVCQDGLISNSNEKSLFNLDPIGEVLKGVLNESENSQSPSRVITERSKNSGEF